MPPVYAAHKLTKQEIERLTEWIAQGAQWQQHWAFTVSVRPPLPVVKKRTWPGNGIDSFVLAKLEKEGLGPGGGSRSRGPDPPRFVRSYGFAAHAA